MSSPASPVSLDADDLRVLLRVADLQIDDARIPALLAEVNTQLGFAATLDRVLEGVATPALAPFDPSWPPSDAEGGAQ